MPISGAVVSGDSDKPVGIAATQLDRRPFIVALTGGIASGKTLISDGFANLGVPVIDTDVIAHQIVEPGQPALQEIEATFGAGVIEAKGRLKRSELRSIIFSDPEARIKLESILHPRIRQKVEQAIAELTDPYCILVIPLLAEKGGYQMVDRVLVVDVSVETQVSRLMTRDECSRKEAQDILATQASRSLRLEIADDVLENSGSVEDAVQKVLVLHERYLELSGASS